MTVGNKKTGSYLLRYSAQLPVLTERGQARLREYGRGSAGGRAQGHQVREARDPGRGVRRTEAPGRTHCSQTPREPRDGLLRMPFERQAEIPSWRRAADHGDLNPGRHRVEHG